MTVTALKVASYAFLWGMAVTLVVVKAGPWWAGAVAISWLGGLFAGMWVEERRTRGKADNPVREQP